MQNTYMFPVSRFLTGSLGAEDITSVFLNSYPPVHDRIFFRAGAKILPYCKMNWREIFDFNGITMCQLSYTLKILST